MLGAFIDRLRYSQPQWFYDLAPYLYIALAALIYWKPGGPLATLSSLALIVAAVWIFYLRLTHRHAKKIRGNEELALVSLIWDRSRECEHEILDAEHRALFIAGQELVVAVNGGQPETINVLIRDMISKLNAHFEQEEKILNDANPNVAEAHRAEHRALLDKITALYRGYFVGQVKCHQLIECLVYEAIVEHARRDKMAVAQAFWD